MNLTNYFEHPSDNRYMVYRFQMRQHAAFFEEQITEANVIFEKHEEEENGTRWIMYGVSKEYKDIANRANHMTSARYRQKFIPNRLFRNLVLLIGLGAMLLAIISYFMNQ